MPTLIGRRHFIGGALASSVPRAAKSATPRIKLGVLTDAAGSYADIAGPGSFAAVQLAAADFRAVRPDIPVDVVMGDFQLKPDLAVSIVRSWFDEQGIDAVLDVPSSSAALAISHLVRSKDKVALFSGAITTELTGASCSPNHVHWMYDSYSIASGAAHALLSEGGDKWFFIAADNAMGSALTRDASNRVRDEGGSVLGVVRHPATGASDFSSFILQAQTSGANVLALATAGNELVTLVKQVAEFGLRQSGLKIAAFGAEFPLVATLGSDCDGLYVTYNFYANRNEQSQLFARRLAQSTGKPFCSSLHASAYSAAWHYLKTVASMGPDAAKTSGAGTVARMKAIPTEDPVLGSGEIRTDGRKLNPMFLLKGKARNDVQYPGDLLSVVREIPPEAAFLAISPSCKMESVR
ncbi:ABC transporter substrate-binding protein [Bradyrhizobium sp. CB82]|uniref:ABC transporter substrate-binding protein n=1 Tax=Bradyrhizobium sp. CB82 TaxID=3039159 RepID=UPI0024B1447A|nr:ABC transporter substrate-binding protein [Bradyrhizobium sp. CB82]WFU41534.1 ABC transporter substrate-binding protein [Bradyrhizobium sp. CB82]